MLSEEQENKIAAEFVAKTLGGEIRNASPAWISINFGPKVDPKFVGAWGGRGISIYTNDKDKWSVDCHWPFDEGRSQIKPAGWKAIKVSKSRGLQALCDEINRRLLKTYNEEYEKQMHFVKLSFELADHRSQVFKKLLGILNYNSHPREEQECQAKVYHHQVSEMRVNHDGTQATINIYALPVDVATDVLKLLAERCPE